MTFKRALAFFLLSSSLFSAPNNVVVTQENGAGALVPKRVTTAVSLPNPATVADLRSLYGLVIGTHVQAFDADLSTYAGITPSANVQSVLGAADYSAIRTQLGLVIGTNVQAFDADLTTYAGITPSADVQSVLAAASAAAIKTILSIGNVENTAISTWAGSANIVTVGTLNQHLTLGGGVTPSEIRWLEGSAGGVNYAGFKAPATLAGNTIYEFPAAFPGSDLVLQSSAAGVLSWVANGGGGSMATDALWDAAGDLAIGTGANTGAKLTIGTANMLLQVNAGATAPEWTDTITVSGVTATSGTITTLIIGGVTITTSGTELNFVDGVTSAIQTQLDAKAPLASPTFTGTVTLPTPFTLGAVSVLPTGTELNFVDGVTSAIQTQLDAKAPTASPTFTGSVTLAEDALVVLDSVLSADGKATGTAIPGTAGAALAVGDLVVLDVTDSRWELADANSAAAADGDARGLIGICILVAASDGDPTRILVSGTVRADAAFPAFTVGAPIFVSETAGDLTNTSPTTEDNVVRVIGYGIDGNSMLVQPGTFITYDAP